MCGFIYIIFDHRYKADMGMTYEELSLFGYLRKVCRCGPYEMASKLMMKWKHLSESVVRNGDCNMVSVSHVFTVDH